MYFCEYVDVCVFVCVCACAFVCVCVCVICALINHKIIFIAICFCKKFSLQSQGELIDMAEVCKCFF